MSRILTNNQSKAILEALQASNKAITLLMETREIDASTEDEVLSIQEGADFLHVSKSTFLRLIHQNAFSYQDLASADATKKSMPRVLKSELIRFIKSGMPAEEKTI